MVLKEEEGNACAESMRNWQVGNGVGNEGHLRDPVGSSDSQGNFEDSQEHPSIGGFAHGTRVDGLS